MRHFLTLFAAALTTATAAAADWPSQFGCPHCRCGRACVLKVEQVDAEEDCYEVECEEVCIPAVTFPWESCRTPKCGRSRVVARLTEESRPTKECEYEWVLACPKCGRIEKNGEKNGAAVPPAPKAPMSPMPPMPAPMPPAAPPAAGTAPPRGWGSAGVVRPPFGHQPLRPVGFESGRSSTR
ncbi:MAG TPA: hypothetical protein VF170_18730 [Planctomycetaceae bacterium]